MKKFILWSVAFFSFSLAAAAGAPLVGEPPIALGGPAGKFDFMGTDSANSRVLAAHRDTKSLEIVDLKTGKPLPSIEVGAAQGVAVDSKNHRYFLGNEAEHDIAIVDSRTLKKTGEVKVDGPVDAIAFDDKNGMLYAAKDDGDRLWVVDPKSRKVAATVPIEGFPEVLEYDPVTDRIYLNLKNKNAVVRIDPASNRVDATWSTLPATSPHGLAVDSKRGRLYSAGRNGKLVSIDLANGKVLASADISPGVDQIAFDPVRQSVYSGCNGFISVTKVTDGGLEAIANVPTTAGARTLAIDPATHDVWISFADTTHSYVQKFKSAK